MRRVDQGFAPPVVAMLRAASALRQGEVSGHVVETSEATSGPLPGSTSFSGATTPFYSDVQRSERSREAQKAEGPLFHTSPGELLFQQLMTIRN